MVTAGSEEANWKQPPGKDGRNTKRRGGRDREEDASSWVRSLGRQEHVRDRASGLTTISGGGQEGVEGLYMH